MYVIGDLKNRCVVARCYYWHVSSTFCFGFKYIVHIVL